MVWAVWGLPKCRKFTCSGDTFQGNWLLLIPKWAKFGCSGHTFQGCWLLLILMMVSTQKYVQLII